MLSSLIRAYTICHSQQSDQCLHNLSFLAVSSRSTLLAILTSLIKFKIYTVILRNCLIKVYTICHLKQSDQSLHCLPFSAVWSRSTLFTFLSKQYYQGLHWSPFSAGRSGSTQLAMLSSLIKVKVYTVILRNSVIRIYIICHSQQSDQCLQCLPFSAVWSGSTLFAIVGSLIRVYTICQSKQSDQGLHSLRFFLSSIIKVYSFCDSQHFDQVL